MKRQLVIFFPFFHFLLLPLWSAKLYFISCFKLFDCVPECLLGVNYSVKSWNCYRILCTTLIFKFFLYFLFSFFQNIAFIFLFSVSAHELYKEVAWWYLHECAWSLWIIWLPGSWCQQRDRKKRNGQRNHAKSTYWKSVPFT
jgi:hypothetical protein